MMRAAGPRWGALPADAALRLRTASQVGRSGSIERAKAIDRVYRWIEDTYPEYLRRNDQ